MGKVSATSPYTNKKGDLRMGVQFDYSLALRIATGEVDALQELRAALTSRVEAYERKSEDGSE